MSHNHNQTNPSSSSSSSSSSQPMEKSGTKTRKAQKKAGESTRGEPSHLALVSAISAESTTLRVFALNRHHSAPYFLHEKALRLRVVGADGRVFFDSKSQQWQQYLEYDHVLEVPHLSHITFVLGEGDGQKHPVPAPEGERCYPFAGLLEIGPDHELQWASVSKSVVMYSLGLTGNQQSYALNSVFHSFSGAEHLYKLKKRIVYLVISVLPPSLPTEASMTVSFQGVSIASSSSSSPFAEGDLLSGSSALFANFAVTEEGDNKSPVQHCSVAFEGEGEGVPQSVPDKQLVPPCSVGYREGIASNEKVSLAMSEEKPFCFFTMNPNNIARSKGRKPLAVSRWLFSFGDVAFAFGFASVQSATTLAKGDDLVFRIVCETGDQSSWLISTLSISRDPDSALVRLADETKPVVVSTGPPSPRRSASPWTAPENPPLPLITPAAFTPPPMSMVVSAVPSPVLEEQNPQFSPSGSKRPRDCDDSVNSMLMVDSFFAVHEPPFKMACTEQANTVHEELPEPVFPGQDVDAFENQPENDQDQDHNQDHTNFNNGHDQDQNQDQENWADQDQDQENWAYQDQDQVNWADQDYSSYQGFSFYSPPLSYDPDFP